MVITTVRTTPDELKESNLFIRADICTSRGTTKIVEHTIDAALSAHYKGE